MGSKCSGGFVIVAVAVLSLLSTPARAQPEYLESVRDIRAGRYQEARNRLNSISSTGCKAMAFYLLSVAHAHLGDAGATIRAASRSLQCQPALAQRYRAGSVELLNWAALNLAGYRIRLNFGFSEASDRLRDLSTVAAINQLISTAEGQVPGLSERLRRAMSTENLNGQFLCLLNALNNDCGDDTEVPAVALPNDDE